MDTFSAFAKGEANRHRELMVFDWHKAARLILENPGCEVRAGLAADWEYTGGLIHDGESLVMSSYTYLSSTWATPEIEIDGDLHDCFVMKSEAPEWDAKTKWPESALKILGEAQK